MLRANALSLTVSARSPLEKFKGSEGMETLAITAIVSDFQHPAVLNVCHPIHLNSKFNRLDHETIGLYPSQSAGKNRTRIIISCKLEPIFSMLDFQK